MTKPRTGRALPILGLIVLVGAVGGFTFARSAGLHFSANVRWLVLLASLPSTIWLTRIYWRGLDEAAREAQKTAWFWGGSIGAVLGIIAISARAPGDPTLWGLLPQQASAVVMLQTGAVIVLGAQLAGFFVAWAIWWWRMR